MRSGFSHRSNNLAAAKQADDYQGKQHTQIFTLRKEQKKTSAFQQFAIEEWKDSFPKTQQTFDTALIYALVNVDLEVCSHILGKYYFY